MKNHKTFVLAAVLAAGITLSGCAADSDSSFADPDTTAGLASTTATPAATESASPEQKDSTPVFLNNEKPLGINPVDVVANADASAIAKLEEAAAEGKDIEKEVRFGLVFYENLVSHDDFYQARDTTKDWERLKHLEGLMTSDVLMDIEESRKKYNGQVGGFAQVDKNGSFDTIDGWDLTPVGIPESKWHNTKVEIVERDDSTKVLWISGYRDMKTKLQSGETVNIKLSYNVRVISDGRSKTMFITGFASDLRGIDLVSKS